MINSPVTLLPRIANPHQTNQGRFRLHLGDTFTRAVRSSNMLWSIITVKNHSPMGRFAHGLDNWYCRWHTFRKKTHRWSFLLQELNSNWPVVVENWYHIGSQREPAYVKTKIRKDNSIKKLLGLFVIKRPFSQYQSYSLRMDKPRRILPSQDRIALGFFP